MSVLPLSLIHFSHVRKSSIILRLNRFCSFRATNKNLVTKIQDSCNYYHSFDFGFAGHRPNFMVLIPFFLIPFAACSFCKQVYLAANVVSLTQNHRILFVYL